MIFRIFFFIGLLFIFSVCSNKNLDVASSEIVSLNKNAKNELGHYLFFDKRLSIDKKLSCSTCHDPSLAFTDGYKVSLNSHAEKLLRNAPSLLNIGARTSFNWANSKITTLQQQMEIPMFGTHPVELGIKDHEDEIIKRLISDSKYKKMLRNVFGRDLSSIRIAGIIDAIAGYVHSLNSRQSRYDQFLQSRDSTLLSEKEWIGLQLFNSDSIECSACHGGKDFFEPSRGGEFANIGLYNCNGSYPISDSGLQMEDGDIDYNGVFRIPSLRNIAVTGPYYHDGSEESLINILKNYERQGRMVNFGDCQGDGSQHPLTDGRLQKFKLTEDQRESLIAFLNTLTDTSYLSNPYFRNPFE